MAGRNYSEPYSKQMTHPVLLYLQKRHFSSHSQHSSTALVDVKRYGLKFLAYLTAT
jgi:hypothetical protein